MASTDTSLTPGSQDDISAWANDEFPDYFKAFVDTECPITETISFDGEHEDGKIILKSMLVIALEVGCTDAGDPTAVQPKLGFFKSHFRAACRDVARGRGALVDGDDTDESDTLPDNSPPDLVADTDTTGLRDNPAATSIFNQHVHAMDESYHDFKTRMLSQLGAMQMVKRNQTDQLKAQIQELQCRLAASEEGRAKMGDELEAEKVKARTEAEQAAAWKTQYEDLKGTLERVLSRPPV
ncbi:hypothetical protein N0V95_005748 [Ascochyta clinopodiicola]|nr:hypothetical protein N0V95_005748 [Ascochyta clinopodiicola]